MRGCSSRVLAPIPPLDALAVAVCVHRRAKAFYADAPNILARDADLQLRAATAGGWVSTSRMAGQVIPNFP